jgi:hypothetical protein
VVYDNWDIFLDDINNDTSESNNLTNILDNHGMSIEDIEEKTKE